jgi:High potential iron-sulfur protein
MNPHHNRRVFIMRAVIGTSAFAACRVALAEEEKVTETEAYAKSMGFRVDTTKVDQAKYPRHDAATQQCSKCQLYDGKPGDALGPCSFFGGRLVSPNGWCRNFKAKKAA